MLHPLPPQLLKFVPFRNHCQQVVCVKLHILGGQEDFTLWTHTSVLCQAVPVPENNLTRSLWTEAEPKTSLLSLYSFFQLEWMEAKPQCHWLILPSPALPLLAGVFWLAVPVPWFLPRRCMSDVSRALLFQDRLQTNTCLQANPLPTRGQMTQARAQKYLTPLCQEIFQHQAQKEQSAEQKANCAQQLSV